MTAIINLHIYREKRPRINSRGLSETVQSERFIVI